jgi:ferredoxin
VNVEFTKTKKTVAWSEDFDNLLDFAEENGVDIEYECREGYCGSCKVKLLGGRVDMEDDTGLEEEDKEAGMILPCVSVPATDIKLEA